MLFGGDGGVGGGVGGRVRGGPTHLITTVCAVSVCGGGGGGVRVNNNMGVKCYLHLSLIFYRFVNNNNSWVSHKYKI